MDVHSRLLDNPIWTALTTSHADLAEGTGPARRYDPEVSPFTAIDTPDLSSLDVLGDLIAVDGRTPGDHPSALFRVDLPSLPPTWTEHLRGRGEQMVLEQSIEVADDVQIVALENTHVPAMVDLVERTQPGPFRERTIELGGYVGVFDDGRLVAMAGQRLRLPGYGEISAVCTDPDARGRGLAEAVSRRVAADIIERGDTPFLHCAVGNDGARRLYERLGFVTRAELEFVAFTPTVSPSSR